MRTSHIQATSDVKKETKRALTGPPASVRRITCQTSMILSRTNEWSAHTLTGQEDVANGDQLKEN